MRYLYPGDAPVRSMVGLLPMLRCKCKCRLMIGSVVRAQMLQTKAFDFGKDAAESMRARAAFNQVV